VRPTRGGSIGLRTKKTSYTPTAKELASVLQRGDDQTCLGKKKGSIRSLGMLGVFSGREREKRGFRMTSRISSSLHNNFKFPLLLLCYSIGSGSWCSGRVRRWCVSEVRQQRGAGVVCGLISRSGMG
jgi:hypothetical protein